jgi:hypothetical protein
LLKRRRFLKESVAAIGLAGVGPVVFFASPHPMRAGDFGPFSKASFEALLGGWFRVEDGMWESMQLVEVRDELASRRVEQFSIRFRASPHAELEAGTYPVACDEGGSFELYLEPAGDDVDGRYYVASFSLIRPLTPSCYGGAA